MLINPIHARNVSKLGNNCCNKKSEFRYSVDLWRHMASNSFNISSPHIIASASRFCAKRREAFTQRPIFKKSPKQRSYLKRWMNCLIISNARRNLQATFVRLPAIENRMPKRQPYHDSIVKLNGSRMTSCDSSVTKRDIDPRATCRGLHYFSNRLLSDYLSKPVWYRLYSYITEQLERIGLFH